MPLGVPPRAFGVPLAKDGHVLELPQTDDNANVSAMYRSMLHGLPVINGYAGYIPRHADILEWALRRRDPSVLTELRRGHPLYVAVADGLEAPTWTAFMDAQNDARMLGVSGAGRLYLMPAAPSRQHVTIGAGPDPCPRRQRQWLVALRSRRRRPCARSICGTRGHVVWLQQTIRVDTSLDGVTWTIAADEPPGDRRWPRR